MTTLTNNEAIKEVRKTARDNGLTFKRNTTTGLYGAYNRTTGALVTEFTNLMSAYHSMQQDWFEANKAA